MAGPARRPSLRKALFVVLARSYRGIAGRAAKRPEFYWRAICTEKRGSYVRGLALMGGNHLFVQPSQLRLSQLAQAGVGFRGGRHLFEHRRSVLGLLEDEASLAEDVRHGRAEARLQRLVYA